MKRSLAVLGVAVLTGACAAPQTRRLRLPGLNETLESRVVAYRELEVMPHRNWSGWRMRAGQDGDLREVNEVRSWMQNSPESRRVFEDYDSTRRLGFGLLLGGLVATLAAPISLAVALGDRSTRSSVDSGTVAALSLITLAGAVVTTVGAILVGGTEHFVPEASEAYNRWLWRRLRLPERLGEGVAEEAVSSHSEAEREIQGPPLAPRTQTPPRPQGPPSGLGTESPW